MTDQKKSPTQAFNHSRQPGEEAIDLRGLRAVDPKEGRDEIVKALKAGNEAAGISKLTYNTFSRIERDAGSGQPVAVFEHLEVNRGAGVAFKDETRYSKDQITQYMKEARGTDAEFMGQWGDNANVLRQGQKALDGFKAFDAANRPQAAKDFKPN